jgi:DNA-binding transcriptional regulator YhcF (GntR family)
VPSVRDLAGEFEVNRNTVMRTYSILQDAGIFENKRGIGFFVSGNAAALVKNKEKTNFFNQDLPQFIHKVKLLKLTRNDLVDLFKEINNNENHENK